jgi:cytochrome c-type biogenesis protein CcmH
LLALLAHPLTASAAADLEEQTRAIASELRCVVCQNLSVADSPSEMAQQMRAIVREQLKAGKTPDQIKDFFVSKYGEWVLLAPKTTGLSLILWVLPFVILLLGIAAALWFVRRWSSRKATAPMPKSATDPPLPDDWYRQKIAVPDTEDASAPAQLVRERMRFAQEMTELEFDFLSGKLSESDYTELRRVVESKAATVFQRTHALAAHSGQISNKGAMPQPEKLSAAAPRPNFRRWPLAAGGAFLLIFGLVLGVLLTQSLRPRTSEQDTLTGDFLTGTGANSTEVRAALEEGKKAFANQEFPKAIDAFRKVLAADPNQPEAHTYMGFILVQAGHADGAMMAFDKALAQAPNFPMAMWGKAMILYRDKKDYDSARQLLQRLLQQMPAGEERSEIEKIVAEMPKEDLKQSRTQSGESKSSAASVQSISGTISLDPKLKSLNDGHATLFIIARPSGGSAGPPLAVRKIERPVFPLSYSIGAENVMMQGTPFTGNINLSVRLDKDGNPTTRTPGDLLGDYKKNPAAVGSKNIDIVIDQAM